ncbi:MAG TPA: hypothetical protein P5136_00205 [Methanofastidiosum sp.]|nr:hypothetical protein [Methanofastidiosum sp.]
MNTEIIEKCEKYIVVLIVNDLAKSAFSGDTDGIKCASLVLTEVFNKSPELIEDLLDEIKSLSWWRSNTKKWNRIQELKMKILGINILMEDKNEIFKTK